MLKREFKGGPVTCSIPLWINFPKIRSIMESATEYREFIRFFPSLDNSSESKQTELP